MICELRRDNVYIDKCTNYEAQVSAICKSSFFYVHNGLFIWKYLYADSIKKLVHAFIIVTWTAATNCFMVFFSTFCAVRLVFNKRKFDHVSPLLVDLQWLPIKQRIVFKILVITYKSPNRLEPVYISDPLDRYLPNRRLRASSQNLLK